MDDKLKSEITKIIKDNFENNKNQIPWDGMHTITVNKIIKIIEKKA
ncbi:MAG: hypothetical protein H8E03_00390 [Pelagibacteraceae bacterium]|nr:hypothetical protein [Pelagibacteraceae bacterium]